MPKELEQKLSREASQKGLTGDRKDAYIYGTMQKTTDWSPDRGSHDFHNQSKNALKK